MWHCAVLRWFASALIVAVGWELAVAEPIRIMPLGDSLTRGLHNGGSIPGGYRTRAYNRLTDELYPVNFVGTASDNPDPFPPIPPDIDWLPDPDHEGHGGQRIDEAIANIESWLAAGQPAVVLLHLGTNDIAQDYLLPAAPARLDTLISQITSQAPDTHVIVAQIIRSPDLIEDAEITAFNSTIPAIVTAHAARGEKVTMVDMHSALSSGDFLDTYHPGKVGYDKMADAWFTAIEALGPITNPPPPPPVPGANIIANKSFSTNSQHEYPALAGDLVNAGQPTLAGVTHVGYAPYNNGAETSRIEALNDGLIGADSVLSDGAFDLDGTWTSIFTLDTSVNTEGYDVTAIRTISGWLGPRTDQKYELFYSTVEAPLVFISLGIFSYLPGADGSAIIELTDLSGVIATGVKSLRFDFMTPSSSDETVYREIDIVGHPTGVPEPTSLALFGLGMLSSLVLRRRRHAAPRG